MNRKIDDLGRIVIPKEIRQKLNIKYDDKLTIEVKNESIILKKAYNDLEVLKKLEDWIKEQIIFVRNIPAFTQEIKLAHTQQIAQYQDILDKIQEFKNEICEDI